MKQPVIVSSITEDSLVQVHYPNPKSDKSNTSRSFWGVKEKDFPVKNREGLDVHPGDMVEILVNPVGAMRAAFMMFIFPLLSFLLFYMLASRVFQAEPLLYLIGVIGLVGGFFVNVIIRKVKGPGEMPTMIRILSQAEIQKWKECNSACKTCKGCGG